MKIDVTRMHSLKNEGFTYPEIASILGCSPSTVHYYLIPGRRDYQKSHARKYAEEQPLVTKVHMFNSNGRRKETVEGSITMEQVREKIGSNPKCYLTGRPIDIDDKDAYSLDHIIPLSRGGDNSINNVGLLGQDINMAKSDKTPEEFIELCAAVLRHHGYDVI